MRHDGLLGNRHRAHTLARCRQFLGTTVAPLIVGETRRSDYRDRYESLTGISLRRCPVCADGQMIVTTSLPRERPVPTRPDTA